MEKQPLPKLKWSTWLHRHSRVSILIIVSVFLLGWALLAGYVFAAKPVNLQVDGQILNLKTKSVDVGQLLQEQLIKLNDGDQVVPGLETRISRKMTITVRRAKPVKLLVDGSEHDLKTASSTVADFLQEAGVSLGPLDLVEPDLNSQLQSGTRVKVSRVVKKLEEKGVAIPFSSSKKEDDQLSKGEINVVQEGKPGKKIQKIEVTYIDGQPENTVVLSEEIVAQPVPKLVAYGTKAVARSVQTSRGELNYRKRLVMSATAYSPEEPGLSNWTYTGARATRGVAAVDPSVIPLGSNLYVEGYGFALAADIGGAIKGNKIDLCYDTLAEVKRFGRRSVVVYLLER